MADKSKYIKYTVRETTTVDKFLSSNNSLLTKSITKDEFLDFKDSNNKSNSFYIYDRYSANEVTDPVIQRKFLDNQLDTIYEGTTLFIPVSEFREELVAIQGNKLFLDQSKDIPVYITEKRKELLQDPLYSKFELVTREGRGVDVQIIEENCQVWIYLKSLDKLIDVSPFVNSLNVQKSDIGQFSITLTPIEVEVDRESNEITGIFISKNNRREYLNHYSIMTIDGLVQQSFFDKYCQQNDTVFIRFEKLKLEEDIIVDKFGINNIQVSKKDIPNQYWDMIGLVDRVGSSINSENTDYTVDISGRDVMKILVEDGAYVMDQIYAKGAENMFYYLGQESDKYFKRNFVTNGGFEYLFKNYYDPLEIYMGFIVNQLSNIGWTGDNDLFDYYPKNEIAEKYSVGISNETQYLENIEKNGIWKICHIKVDPRLSDRRVIDNSFIDTDGTLYEQFKKVCQDPFVEFWGDTFKNQFNLIARQQPFDKKGMEEVLSTEGYIIDIEARDTFQINLGWETEFYSWFQFFPSNELFGNDTFLYSANFPIIYLDKYVEHFGNHRKVVNDNYLSGKAVDIGQGKENLDALAEALFNDLKYVVESYSVLPFTRTGTVVINGDRRIKKGDFVRLKVTGEICYVDAVSNSLFFSRVGVSRSTVLSLKRCMFEDFLKGTSSSYVPGISSTEDLPVFSYFDIVNSDLIIKDLLNRYRDLNSDREVVGQTKQISTNFGVNEDIFNFFLQRRQMDIL